MLIIIIIFINVYALLLLLCVCVYIYIYIYIYIQTLGHWPNARVFNNGPGDWGSIPGQVIPKTKKKMELDAALLYTQH